VPRTHVRDKGIKLSIAIIDTPSSIR